MVSCTINKVTKERTEKVDCSMTLTGCFIDCYFLLNSKQTKIIRGQSVTGLKLPTKHVRINIYRGNLGENH